MTHPYRAQPPRAFWKSTIAGKHPLDVADWYVKRFPIDGARIATAGSCFAQHIGRNLRGRGFRYMDVEPAPEGLPQSLRQDYGYGLYSARYGNIYTARQLLQLLQRALRRFTPVQSHWEKDGGVVDPFRPTLEPEPFGSVAEMEALREDHLERVLRLFRNAEVFVFTLGLTEQWLSRADGAAYPLCPGTAGGVFDPAEHAFHNLTTAEVRADMEAFLALARQINPDIKLILTVSPVPLMATATAQQVAVATAQSKAVLRAAAGELVQAHEGVDYFPSYEIITAPFMKGYFFEADQRAVSPHGVKHVMSVFFDQHPPAKGAGGWVPPDPAPDAAEPDAEPPLRPRMAPGVAETAEQVQCDEELLKAFGPDADPE